MARKYDLISELYNRTCIAVTDNPVNWQSFLKTASRNYRLRFDEQLLIFAQRPSATAVLEIERWNETFGRWVNRGAKGIAVFEDANRNRQRLIHYFDISDTHESRFSRPVPIWEMKPQYEADVIETLENTFGAVNDTTSIENVIKESIANGVEDNIADYISDFMELGAGSDIEYLSADEANELYLELVKNSVAYMVMARLGLDVDKAFTPDDFSGISNFNSQEVLNAVGIATSDIAEMALLPISKTIVTISKENRTFDRQAQTEYNKDTKNERSQSDERNHIHDGRRLQPSEPEIAGADGSNSGQMVADEKNLSEGTSQNPVLQSSDERNSEQSLGGNSTESDRAGGDFGEADGSQRRTDRADEVGRYDEVGSLDEQHQELGTGNREESGNIRLEYYDRTHEDKSLPFFGNDDTIREMLGTTPHLTASKEEIKNFYEANSDNAARTKFIKGIFNNDFTQLTLNDGRLVGYKTFQNVLHLWAGEYENRTAQSFYDWGVIAQHFEAMRLLGELTDTMKPLPSMDGQLTLITDGITEEQKTSVFSFSQEIIDAVLTRGSGISEGKMRIYEQFEKSLSVKENAEFLKNEYGWGGSYPVIIGAGIDEQHDGKGITISKGIGNDKPHITLSWSQVEKRIGELIRMDRYLNTKEKENYPQWLEKQEQRRAELAEQRQNRDILSTAPPNPVEKTEDLAVQYEYHLGDSVYIGAAQYEILSFDENRVMLYDFDMPLFNKEYSREEFDRKVRENPMNDHLKVSDLPAEEKDEISETEVINDTKTEQSANPETDYEDAFFIDRDSESVTWMYYNPDSTAGGQYVTNVLSFSDIQQAAQENKSADEFFDYLGSIARQELADVGTEWFADAERRFKDAPTLTNCTPETMDSLVSVADTEQRKSIATRLVDIVKDTDFYEYQDSLEVGETDEEAIENIQSHLSDDTYVEGIVEYLEQMKENIEDEPVYHSKVDRLLADVKELLPNAYVSTNIGNVPIEDYREIVAMQNGFDSYDEMYQQGIRIGNGYDKEPEPIIPSWEQKKKTKVRSFDLHPDIPLSERNTFDLVSNPVETVGKKERFRRNIMAIQLLKKCQEENRFASPDEQLILSKYVGWGGIPEAFDDRNSAWATEYLELSTVLTPEEYAAARESTLTAFYTPPEVSTAIYKVFEQMGFKEGNLLEPSCGIGNFIGMIPKSMENAKIYGVELDSISAGIAQQLYQKSSIAAQGFEEVNVPDSFFDGVVGNVPFGDFKVSDKRYDKYNFLIHDYFFAKSLDKLRPGGVMALVTSKGTMDKENSNVRKYIAQRAELLGAIRLPNDTFKGNAGTEVVSDILFLQKRDRLIDIEPDWVHLDTDENGIRMNSYFVQHPEMILGEMKMVSGRFGQEATCEPFENADLTELLSEAVSNIHGEISDYEVADELDEEDNSIPADPNVRNFSYTVLNDKIYFRENSRMSPVEVSATAENRIKGMIGIRDCVRNLIELQTEDYPDSEIKQVQERLNTLYDNYTKKYGLINSRANTSAFSDDSSYALLSALEVINEDGELERKADMFFKRTIKPHKPVTEVDTADEALAVSMGEKASIDMEYMMELSGKSEEELFSDLKGVIFLNPLYEYGNSYEPKYLMADEYLSGNVREKLATAKRSAALYPEDYTVNVQALEKVQPKDLTASEISVRLGATWVPTEIVEQFMFDFLDTPRYAQWNIKVHFSQFTGEWNIEGKSYDRSNVKAYSTYGTSRINAYKIFEETLNLKDVRIFDYIEDDEGRKKAVLNKKETAIAQAKQELIKQGFVDWIWADPIRREKLTKMYNEKFNSIRPREYDGSHITFNGMNPEIELREHQKNAVAHILYGGNTLLAHAVGAGKTFEMVAAAMESKRLGLCNKSLFVVPNHLTAQWAAEFLQLYPAANILVATKRDFETKNRKKFCGRIATGDYDAVIIGHSQFEKIPMSIERQRAILEQQLEELTVGIAELKRNRGENFSVKQLEKSRKSVKQKLEKLNNQSRKDDVVTFEELGVDRLFIDESHYYKNLYLYTKMRNVGGIAQTEAQKSSDLFMKCRYLDEITGGRGTVFATGTPISNSMVELYTIQRYLQYNTLVKNNLQHFDSWASTFGETVTAVELTPEGTGYRAKTRFAKFYNLPELMAMFKEVADIKTADMLNLPVPEAHFHNVAVKPSEMQKEMVAALAERAEKVRGGGVDSSVDNMLKITNDGRKLALDQRMLNDMLPDFESSKINACVDNIYRIWDETAEKKSAQLVFCDLSTPKNDGTFSVYNDIRKKLIERGIPESEVRFIHEADTDVKKKELFQKTRKGEVRVLLGSTQKMGAGTNVQDRLIALHDVDCPWRPSDLEQRSGRIVRQGNENEEVNIYRYVTEQTFDAYLYQLVEGKQKFASQIMTSKSPVRSAEDIDETALSYAEIKMLATGNPYIKEKMDLDIQVQKLKLLKSNFLSEKYALEDKIIKYYPQRIISLENRIEGLKQDVETAKQHPKPTDDRFIGMEVKGVFYSEKAQAGKAIIEACKQMNSPDPIPLGKYRGFETELLFNTTERNYEVRLKGATSRNVPLGEDANGNIIRLDNGIERYSESLSLAENDLENTKNQFETAKKEVEKPFIQEKELKTKLARLDELNILLNMDKTENEIVGGEPDEGEVPEKRKEKTYER